MAITKLQVRTPTRARFAEPDDVPAAPDPSADLDGALAAVMGRLVLRATLLTPAVSGCTLLLLPPGPVGRMRGTQLRMQDRELLCASSDNFAVAMTHVQHALREGPDWDVLASAEPAAAADAAAEGERWPVFAAVSRGHDLGAVHAEPMITPNRELIGVVTWYAKVPGALAAERHHLPGRARQITHTLALARRLLELQVPGEELAAALAARAVIAQATGVLMERHSCDASAAFGRLQDSALRQHCALGTAAAVLVDRAFRTDPRATGVQAL